MRQRKDIATRFKYRIRLNWHDECQARIDDTHCDDIIRSNSCYPYTTLSKFRSLSHPESRHNQTDSSTAASNCRCSRFFIPAWQSDSRNKTEKIKAHYDRDVKTILEKWQGHSISAPINHLEGLYNTAIPLYTNVIDNLAKLDPRGVATSHILDLEPYTKVRKLWHKFKRDKTMGRNNYPDVSNIYKQIVDLEQPHNNRVSEFMQQTESRLKESINAKCPNIDEIKNGYHNRYYDISSIFKYFTCRPEEAIQMKNDRYDSGFICKNLLFENKNNAYTVAKIDENTAQILKRIILDEYEAISKTLQEYQEKIETIQQLANQFRQQIGSVILFADNHGLKGKCIVNI
jgi:hypothetical protein